MIDVDKFYRVARNYVGDLNRDLVHHVYEKTHDRLPKDNPEGYFYRAMKNELRGDSKFRKQYDRVKTEYVRHQRNPEDDDSMFEYDVEAVYGVNDPREVYTLLDIDPDRVNSILQEISNDGFRLEVKVFIEMAVDRTANELSEITGVRYKNLLKVRNFVRDEVIKRYGNID